MRSAMEGATFALKSGIDELRKLGVEGDEIVLTGGGANSSTWRQLVADVCAKRVVMLEQDEAAAFGAAMQALGLLCGQPVQMFVHEHLAEKPEFGCEPDTNAVSFYEDAFQSYQSAVDTILPLYQ